MFMQSYGQRLVYFHFLKASPPLEEIAAEALQP